MVETKKALRVPPGFGNLDFRQRSAGISPWRAVMETKIINVYIIF